MTENLINPEEWELFKSMGDPAILVELVNTYLDDSPGLIQQMRTGLAAGDIEQVRRAAHSLKSTSATFGADGLAGIARDMEMLARNGTLDGGVPKLAEIESQYLRVAAKLSELKDAF